MSSWITRRTSSRTSSARSSPRSGPTSGWPSSRATPRSPSCDAEKRRRVDAPRHDRALLLRVPPAPPRRPPGDVVRVQRLRPDPGSRPQVRRPPRRSRSIQKVAGRAGAAGVGRDRRPPAAQERRRRAARHERLRPDQPGVHRRLRHRSGRARHARAHRDLRPDRRRAAPGRTTWSAAGRRRRLAGASSSPRRTPSSTVSVPTNVPPQVAWEFLTKPGQRMTWQPWVTEVAIEGATGGRRGPRLGQPLHARQGRGHRGDPRLAAVRLRHRPDDPRHARADR